VTPKKDSSIRTRDGELHCSEGAVAADIEQLNVDAGCTPTRILPAHLADQISDLAGNERSSALAASQRKASATKASRAAAKKRTAEAKRKKKKR
jgi:hypothetical protein